MNAGNETGKAVVEINVTPMIDVLLVLLIIFLMIQPTVPNGLNSQIPQPSKPSIRTPPSTVVVEVLAGTDGRPVYRINQRPFVRVEIVGELKTIFAPQVERTMFVKGDAALSFRDIAEVVDMGEQAGVKSVGLLTPGIGPGR